LKSGCLEKQTPPPFEIQDVRTLVRYLFDMFFVSTLLGFPESLTFLSPDTEPKPSLQ